MSSRIFTVDLGAWSVKLVIASPGLRGATLLSVIERQIPPGDEPAEARARAVLAALVEELWLRNEAGYVGVYGDQVFTQVLEFGFKHLRRAELEKAVGGELEGVVPLDLESLLLRRFVNRPIDKLLVATKTAAQGDLNQTVSIRSHDELGELSDSFNNMITGLMRSRDAIGGWTQTLGQGGQGRTRERQQVEDQLLRGGKMAALGELAAGVAHEINNPLTGVLTLSSLMLKKADEAHPWKKDLENIVQQTTRCRNIVRGLLDFARQRKPDKKECDVHALIDRIPIAPRTLAYVAPKDSLGPNSVSPASSKTKGYLMRIAERRRPGGRPPGRLFARSVLRPPVWRTLSRPPAGSR